MDIYIHDGDINQFLIGVGDHLKKQYLKNMYNQLGSKKTLEKNAKILQDFLQYVKLESTKDKNQWTETFKMVMETLKNVPGVKGGFVFNKKYSKTDSEDPFETEMSALIYAIAKNISTKEFAENLKFEDFSLGVKQVSVNLNEKTLERVKRETLQECANIAEEQLSYEDQFGKVYARAGKPDSQGVKVEIRADANKTLIKIYKILERAKFSNKNYADTYWHTNKETGKRESISGSNYLHLGNTNAFKAYYGVLTDSGYGKKETINSFYHAYYHWRKYKSTDDVAKNIYLIRQIYELTGAGSGYFDDNGNFKKIGKVDYLIYNVPDSNFKIYVKSVPEILEQMFKDVFDDDKMGNPFTKVIKISKSIMTQNLNDLTS